MMGKNMRNLFVYSLLLFISVSVYPETNDTEIDEIEEPAVVKFRNLLSARVSLGYKLMFFQEHMLQRDSYRTNRPLDMGMGIGIKNFFIGYSFSIPFIYEHNYGKSPSFDVGFNYYRNRSFTSGFFKFYSGFHNHAAGNIELQILTLGISQEFLLNRNHSLRSVYVLDEKQMVSNGSFLIGGGLFFNAIQSNTLSDYHDNQRTIHLGPNFGYSYTWVFRNNFFLNVLSTFGLDLLIPIGDGKVSSGFQILPRVSFGYHGKTWSANIYFNYSALINGVGTAVDYNLISGNNGISFIKRFL